MIVTELGEYRSLIRGGKKAMGTLRTRSNASRKNSGPPAHHFPDANHIIRSRLIFCIPQQKMGILFFPWSRWHCRVKIVKANGINLHSWDLSCIILFVTTTLRYRWCFPFLIFSTIPAAIKSDNSNL